MFRARDHRGLDGDLKAEDDRRRTRFEGRSEAEDVVAATFLPREEWAKPRGRKSQQRRCGSDDRGEAGLRPDRAINEATCVRVLNRNFKEMTWRISALLNKRFD
ncbi:hypothetical protein XI08_39885 [Bradyrhizobium sp. CCBAU 11361]|nr:hypothetical protein [Bradyrhizobium sp. CCBAU 11361]